MAQYTNQQLNSIYSYLGYNFYIDFEPQISQAITATQQVSDGGDQPDTTLQTQLLNLVSTLQGYDAQLLQLSYIAFVEQSSKGSTVDPIRGDWLLRKQGTALINQMCIILGIKGVRKAYYSQASLRDVENGLSWFPEDY